MTIKTILACLTTMDGADGVLRVAAAPAERHAAHLIGLRTTEALIAYPDIAMHIPDTVAQDYGASQRQETEALKSVFEKHTRNGQFVSEWRLLKSETETAADRIVESAAAADIVVIGGASSETQQSANLKLLETVIRQSGRPVLVVPPQVENAEVGHVVMIGWNGSREAVRAAHDALSLLHEGNTAHILHVADGSRSDVPDTSTNELAAAFARHGVDTTVIQRTWNQPGVAAALNREAFERCVDMIAIVAFGHSRTYDLLIGAATRELLTRSDLPVLFSR